MRQLSYDGVADRLLQDFYPLAYYAAFFSIRANAFSYEIMCQGRDKLEYYLADYKNGQIPCQKGTGYIKRYEDCSGNVRQRL